MKRILLSLMTVGAVSVVAVLATGAFFSDTETSVNNTFQAGALDLKVDSESHYAGLTCTEVEEGVFEWEEDVQGQSTRPDLIGEPCDGTWEETDLGAHKFFNLTDVKPGDSGEDTISLHVVDNDAWGWFTVASIEDHDNDCTEPESESVNDPECSLPLPSPGNGELRQNLMFNVWLDQGVTPGFQNGGNNGPDPGEGDNIFNQGDVPLGSPGPIDLPGENYNLWQILAGVRSGLGSACDTADPDGDGQTVDPSGAYLVCQGLAVDGRLVGSTTYYFGVEWELPSDVGNEVQTDRFVADMTFVVEQHRNNPSPSPLPTL